MKAYITKLTAELKSSDCLRYRNKIYCFVGCFHGAWLPATYTYGKSNRTKVVGR